MFCVKPVKQRTSFYLDVVKICIIHGKGRLFQEEESGFEQMFVEHENLGGWGGVESF